MFRLFVFLKDVKQEGEREREQEMKNHVGVAFLGWDSIFAVYETSSAVK